MNSLLRAALSLPLTIVMATSVLACGPDYPNCRNDDQCHEREYCVNGRCEQCRANTDCDYGQHCESGACVADAYECSADADCGPGRGCVDHRCVSSGAEDTTTSPVDGDDGVNTCGMTPVYFGFDEATLTTDARRTLADATRCIAADHSNETRLTGMTDPRGTEEYNFTLGERRAHAVRDYMARMGIPRDRIRANSLGEEYAAGSDEESWARDRRVDVAPR